MKGSCVPQGILKLIELAVQPPYQRPTPTETSGP